MSTSAALRVQTELTNGHESSQTLDENVNVNGGGSLHLQTADPSTQSVWLLNPVLDTLFCCGGIVWLLFLVSYLFNGTSGPHPIVQTMAVIAIVGAHLFSEPHVTATLTRVYRTPETRRLLAPWTHWAALICAAAALAGLLVPGVTPVLTKIYLLWVVQHFTSQTYGFALMYCYRGGYKLSPLERHALALLMHVTAAFAMIRQLTYYEWSANGFLAQKLPMWGPLPEWILQSCTVLLALSAFTFAALIAKRALTTGQTLPLPACMTIVTGVLIFTIGQLPSQILWIFVPAFYHGSQYLILSAHYYLKRNIENDGLKSLKLTDLITQSSGIRYYGFLFVSAMFVYIAVPRLLQEFGFNYTLAFATIFATVNIHHFLTDSAIWKLKDQKVRSVLMS